MLAHALPLVDWSDAYAVEVPTGAPRRDPQEWADAVFRAPPPLVRVLFGARELLVRIVGIERGGRHVFDTVSLAADEVLLGVDQAHLGFRASVLVEQAGRGDHGRRAAQPSRSRLLGARPRFHPFVVRAMLARAARSMYGDAGRTEVTS